MARPSSVTDQEIIHCLNDGMTQADIAERYGVSPATICNRVKKINKGNTPPEKITDPVVFNIMDTVIRKKDRQWFRIIAQEDVFYELRPLGLDKKIGSSKDIDVHVKDLQKNYIKKDYPAVKVYNLADQEEKKEDEPMDINNAIGKLQSIQTSKSVPAVEVVLEPEDGAFGQCHGVTTEYSVKREFLYRIDQILDAVGMEASDVVMEHTGRLIAQIIEEGMKGE